MSIPTVTVGTPLQVQAAPAALPDQAAITPPVETPKKEDPFSPRFAALSRQEKKLRDEQAAFKTQRESQEKEWASKLEGTRKYEDLRTRAKSDRSAAQELLSEAGLTYEDLTKLHLNGGKPTAEMIAEQARRDTEALRKEMGDRDAQAKVDKESSQKQRVEQAVQTFKGQIGEFLNAKPDDYELTLNYQDPHTGLTGSDLIYDLIEAHYDKSEKETGKGLVMAHEDAAKAVEAYLEKEYEEKILSRKKIQAKFGKQADPTGSPTQPAGPGIAQHGSAGGASNSGVVSPGSKPVGARTLTNADQTTVATPPTATPKSRSESLAEAAKLLRWSQGS